MSETDTTLERMAAAFHERYFSGEKPYGEYQKILAEVSMRRALEVLRTDLGPFNDKEWWAGKAIDDRFDEIIEQ